MITLYIGIGSNLGDRKESCLRAIEELQRRGIKVTKRSALYETEPWGVKEQPRFINMVIEAETDQTPRKLLEIIKEIEREIGREETYRWGPRMIDLDILLYGDLIIDEPDLKIPHPHMLERDFVLRPLLEIAPDVMHPVLKKRIREIS